MHTTACIRVASIATDESSLFLPHRERSVAYNTPRDCVDEFKAKYGFHLVTKCRAGAEEKQVKEVAQNLKWTFVSSNFDLQQVLLASTNFTKNALS